MSSDSIWADNVADLQHQLAVLTVENARLKAQLQEAQSTAAGAAPAARPQTSNREAYERELSAMKAKLPALLEEYGGKVVAIRQGEVVDSDSDEAALAMRIAAAYPDDYVLVQQVTASGGIESYMGAPLWENS
jgi:hypothetical protein